MSVAASVEEEIHFPDRCPTLGDARRSESPTALNGDPFDVIRKHDSRPSAEERTKQSWILVTSNPEDLLTPSL